MAFVFLLVATMLMIWFERKVIADMQNRIGPNKAGPWGILQTLADGIKLFFKEDLHPRPGRPRSCSGWRRSWPFVPAFLMFSVVPLGGDFSDGNDGVVEIFGHETYLQVADPPIGILFVLAMSARSPSTASCSPAGRRARSTRCSARCGPSAQMVSYEAALGLSVATVVLVARHALDQRHRRRARTRCVDWNLVATGVVPFVIFLIAAPPSSTGRRSTSSRPSRSSSAASTPSTRRSASRCSTWPSS